MTVVGLGTWITFNVGNDPLARDACAAVMRAFFDAGGRVVDSSPMYGSSQSTIGHGLQRVGAAARVFAADKVWTSSGPRGAEQIDASRRFWGVPRFDLLQVHNLLNWQEHLPMLCGRTSRPPPARCPTRRCARASRRTWPRCDRRRLAVIGDGWQVWSTYRPSDLLLFSARTYRRLFELYNADHGAVNLLLALAILYPLIGLLLGRPVSQSEFVGAAPDPTAIATLAMLLRVPASRWLWVIPVGWLASSSGTLLLLDAPDALVPAAAAALAAIIPFLEWVRKRY